MFLFEISSVHKEGGLNKIKKNFKKAVTKKPSLSWFFQDLVRGGAMWLRKFGERTLFQNKGFEE
jgi:hypothetical protein